TLPIYSDFLASTVKISNVFARDIHPPQFRVIFGVKPFRKFRRSRFLKVHTKKNNAGETLRQHKQQKQYHQIQKNQFYCFPDIHFKNSLESNQYLLQTGLLVGEGE